MIVLGYHWLTCYNPLIDWVLGSITFRQPLQPKSKSSPSAETLPSTVPSSSNPSPVPEPQKPIPPVNPKKLPRVTLINAASYARASKLEGSECFRLTISHPEVTGHSTATEPTVDMNNVPEEYHDFADVFSKSKAGKLADHRPYDLKITLDEGTSPPFGPIYSLSQQELAALRKFIDVQGSFVPHVPHTGLRSSSFRRKTALFDFASIFEASNESPRKTDIHFRSFTTS